MGWCDLAIKKNEKLPNDETFCWYMLIGNTLYYTSPGHYSEKVNVVPLNISSNTDYIEYEIVNPTDEQTNEQKFETETSEHGRLKKLYKIKFAIDIKEIVKNSKKIIRLHTQQYLRGFDQDVVLCNVYKSRMD